VTCLTNRISKISKNFYDFLVDTNDALYLNQDYKDAYEKKKKVELHVFGKDGTLHEILSFDQYIIGISVDMSHGILYGLSYDDCIYAYDIRNNGRFVASQRV
jgi:hypothetical protein